MAVAQKTDPTKDDVILPPDDESARDGAPSLTLDVPEPAQAGAAQNMAQSVDDDSVQPDADEQDPDTDHATVPQDAAPEMARDAIRPNVQPHDEKWKAAMDDASERMDGAALADAATKGAVLNVTLSDEAFGLDVSEDAAADDVEPSAFDRDEITDPTADGIDPLMTLVGGGERPWENEGLSFLERMAMYGYNRNADTVQNAQNAAARINSAVVIGAAVAGVAMAVNHADARTMVTMRDIRQTAAGPHMSSQGETTPSKNGAGDKGVPTNNLANKAAKTETEALRAEAAKPAARQIREAAIQQNAEDVTARRARDMAATVKMAAPANLGGRDADMADELLMNTGPNGGHDLVWDGGKDAAPDGQPSLFDQTLAYLHAQVPAADATLSAEWTAQWRASMWAEKRAEFGDTAQMVTEPPETPQTPALRPPEPAPDMEQNFQMSFSPSMGM